MKKIALLVLSLVMALTAICPAFAAGKLEVVQEKFYSVELYENSFSAYVYAEVINSGDKPVKCHNSLWEIYDANGDTLDSMDYVSCHPDVLQPGQTGYVLATIRLDDVESADAAADYLLTLSGKSDNETVVVTLPATAAYIHTQGEYTDTHELIATVTNETNETIYDVVVAFAVKDAEGNLVYVEEAATYNVGIMPGTSMEVRSKLTYNSMVEYLMENGIMNFDKVEVVAYAELDD